MLPSIESFHGQNREIHWGSSENLIVPDSSRFKKILTPIVLGVVHPGFRNYSGDSVGDDHNDERYLQYQMALSSLISTRIAQDQAVLVWTPSNRILETLAFIKQKQSNQLILIPTEEDSGSITVDAKALNIRNDMLLFSPIAQQVSRIDLCGEYGYGCIQGIIESQLIPNGINYEPIDGAIYNFSW
jgi:hypothetical protein